MSKWELQSLESKLRISPQLETSKFVINSQILSWKMKMILEEIFGSLSGKNWKFIQIVNLREKAGRYQPRTVKWEPLKFKTWGISGMCVWERIGRADSRSLDSAATVSPRLRVQPRDLKALDSAVRFVSCFALWSSNCLQGEVAVSCVDSRMNFIRWRQEQIYENKFRIWKFRRAGLVCIRKLNTKLSNKS